MAHHHAGLQGLHASQVIEMAGQGNPNSDPGKTLYSVGEWPCDQRCTGQSTEMPWPWQDLRNLGKAASPMTNKWPKSGELGIKVKQIKEFEILQMNVTSLSTWDPMDK